MGNDISVMTAHVVASILVPTVNIPVLISALSTYVRKRIVCARRRLLFRDFK